MTTFRVTIVTHTIKTENEILSKLHAESYNGDISVEEENYRTYKEAKDRYDTVRFSRKAKFKNGVQTYATFDLSVYYDDILGRPYDEIERDCNLKY